jgi:acyl-CoA hydrolase
VPTVRHATALRRGFDVIATEHGVAELRGASTSKRAARIINIANPSQRDALAAAASRMGL